MTDEEKLKFLERYRLAVRKLQEYLFRVELKDLEIDVDSRRIACERVGVEGHEMDKVRQEEVKRAYDLSNKVFEKKKSNFDREPYYQEETFRKPNGNDFPQAF